MATFSTSIITTLQYYLIPLFILLLVGKLEHQCPDFHDHAELLHTSHFRHSRQSDECNTNATLLYGALLLSCMHINLLFVESFSPTPTTSSRRVSSQSSNRLGDESKVASVFSYQHNNYYFHERKRSLHEKYSLGDDIELKTTNRKTKKKKKVRSPAASSYEPNDDYNNLTASSTSDINPEIDTTNIDEAQVLLACRSYLLRKHKLEWTDKKRRVEAANSPLNSEGYFWHDPSDLIYLREKPDPYDLSYIYNDISNDDDYGYNTTYDDKNNLEEDDDDDDPSASEEENMAYWAMSNNPFSTNPAFTYPSSEHIRRSNSKLRLWNNSTWKEQWYNKRWKGRVVSRAQKTQRRQDKLLGDIPSDILESPKLASLSEEEVTEAIITYLQANQRKSEARKNNKKFKEAERMALRQWRKNVQIETEIARDNGETTMKGILLKADPPSSMENALSFEPSAEIMQKIQKIRGEKSKRAFATRMANTKTKNGASTSGKGISKLRRSPKEDGNPEHGEDDIDEEGTRSPMQSILLIDMALDNNDTPSPIDVETILKPGRLGRRRHVLRRILSECFDLRGKCVPRYVKDGVATAGEDGDDHQSMIEKEKEEELLFVTKCTIDELGSFVLAKLRYKIRNM